MDDPNKFIDSVLGKKPKKDFQSEREAIERGAKELGIDPIEYATAISYESAGTFDPWVAGPTTKWGQHRGTIQYGEPQRKAYGVYQGQSFEDQVTKSNVKYLRDAGVKPGMTFEQIYAAINGGSVKKNLNTQDANTGRTIADNIRNAIRDHRQKVIKRYGWQDPNDAFIDKALGRDMSQPDPNAFIDSVLTTNAPNPLDIGIPEYKGNQTSPLAVSPNKDVVKEVLPGYQEIPVESRYDQPTRSYTRRDVSKLPNGAKYYEFEKTGKVDDFSYLGQSDGRHFFKDVNGDEYSLGDDGKIKPETQFPSTIELKDGGKLARLSDPSRYNDERGDVWKASGDKFSNESEGTRSQIEELKALGEASAKGEARSWGDADTSVAFSKWLKDNGYEMNDQNAQSLVDSFNTERKVRSQADFENEFRSQKGYDDYLRFVQENKLDDKEFEQSTIDAYNEDIKKRTNLANPTPSDVQRAERIAKLRNPAQTPANAKEPASKPESFSTRIQLSGDKRRDIDEFASRISNSLGVDYDTARKYVESKGFAEGDLTQERSARGGEIEFELDANAVRDLKRIQADKARSNAELESIKDELRGLGETDENLVEIGSLRAQLQNAYDESKGQDPERDIALLKAIDRLDAAKIKYEADLKSEDILIDRATRPREQSAPLDLEGVTGARFGINSQVGRTSPTTVTPDVNTIKEEVYGKYGSFLKKYQEEERIKQEYGTLTDSTRPMARPSEFILNIAREFIKAPGQVSNLVGMGVDAMSVAGVNPKDNPFIQFGEGWKDKIDKTKNPDLKDELIVGDVAQGLAQLAQQAILTPFTGGASMLVPIGQAAEGQYMEAAKAGESRNARVWAGVVGGLAAVPDALLQMRFLKNLNPLAKADFIDNLTKNLYTGLAKKLSKNEARQATIAFVGKVGLESGLGAGGENIQERSEDIINKINKKLTQESGRNMTWGDVFKTTAREEQGYTAASIVGALGGGGRAGTDIANSRRRAANIMVEGGKSMPTPKSAMAAVMNAQEQFDQAYIKFAEATDAYEKSRKEKTQDARRSARNKAGEIFQQGLVEFEKAVELYGDAQQEAGFDRSTEIFRAPSIESVLARKGRDGKERKSALPQEIPNEKTETEVPKVQPPVGKATLEKDKLPEDKNEISEKELKEKDTSFSYNKLDKKQPEKVEPEQVAETKKAEEPKTKPITPVEKKGDKEVYFGEKDIPKKDDILTQEKAPKRESPEQEPVKPPMTKVEKPLQKVTTKDEGGNIPSQKAKEPMKGGKLIGEDAPVAGATETKPLQIITGKNGVETHTFIKQHPEKDGVIKTTFTRTRSNRPGEVLEQGRVFYGEGNDRSVDDFLRDFGVTETDEWLEESGLPVRSRINEIQVTEERRGSNGQSVTAIIVTPEGSFKAEIAVPKTFFTEQAQQTQAQTAQKKPYEMTAPAEKEASKKANPVRKAERKKVDTKLKNDDKVDAHGRRLLQPVRSGRRDGSPDDSVSVDGSVRGQSRSGQDGEDGSGQSETSKPVRSGEVEVYEGSIAYEKRTDDPQIYAIHGKGLDFNIFDKSRPSGFQSIKVPSDVEFSTSGIASFVRDLREGKRQPEYVREPPQKQQTEDRSKELTQQLKGRPFTHKGNNFRVNSVVLTNGKHAIVPESQSPLTKKWEIEFGKAMPLLSEVPEFAEAEKSTRKEASKKANPVRGKVDLESPELAETKPVEKADKATLKKRYDDLGDQIGAIRRSLVFRDFVESGRYKDYLAESLPDWFPAEVKEHNRLYKERDAIATQLNAISDKEKPKQTKPVEKAEKNKEGAAKSSPPKSASATRTDSKFSPQDYVRYEYSGETKEGFVTGTEGKYVFIEDAEGKVDKVLEGNVKKEQEFAKSAIVPRGTRTKKGQGLTTTYGSNFASMVQSILDSKGILLTDEDFVNEFPKRSRDEQEFAKSAIDQTDTKEFKNWFGDSKVVDENGDPLKVYHGTTKDVPAFRNTKGSHFGFHFGTLQAAHERLEDTAGRSVRLTDDLNRIDAKKDAIVKERDALASEITRRVQLPQDYQERLLKALQEENSSEVTRLLNLTQGSPTEAETARLSELDAEFKALTAATLSGIRETTEGANIIPVYLRITNPLRAKDALNWGSPKAVSEATGFSGRTLKEIKEKIQEAGYDGIVYQNAVESSILKEDSYIAFEPTQIKSVFNKGTFDPNNPDIAKRSRDEIEAFGESFKNVRFESNEDVLANYKPESIVNEGDGIIGIEDVYEYELLRRLMVMLGENKNTFWLASILEPNQTKKLLEAIGEVQKDHKSKALVDLKKKLIRAQNERNGHVILILDEGAMPEERFQRALNENRIDNRAKQIPQDILKEISDSPEFQKALKSQFGRNYKNESLPMKVEEFVAKIVTNQFNELGLNEKEIDNARELVVKFIWGFKEANGEQALDNLASEIAYVQNIQEQVRQFQKEPKRDSQESKADSQTRPERSQVDGEGEADFGGQEGVKYKNRKHAETLRKNGLDVEDVPYIPETERGWQDKGREIVKDSLNKRGDYSLAIERFQNPVGLTGGERTALGYELIDRLGSEGDYDTMRNIAEGVIVHEGKAGATLRAAQLVSKYDFAKAVEIVQKGLKKQGKELTDEQIDKIREETSKYAHTEEELAAVNEIIETLTAENDAIRAELAEIEEALNEAEKQKTVDDKLIKTLKQQVSYWKNKKIAESRPRRTAVYKDLEAKRPAILEKLKEAFPEFAKSVYTYDDFEIEILDDTDNNASGDSSASVEAINRLQQERNQGTKRVVMDTRSGNERPLIGVDAVDYNPRPYERVLFRGGTRDGEVIQYETAKSAKSVLDEDVRNALIEYTQLEILNHTPYEDLISDISSRTGLSENEIKSIHSDAVFGITEKSGQKQSDKVKEALRIRNEHKKNAKRFRDGGLDLNRLDREILKGLDKDSRPELVFGVLLWNRALNAHDFRTQIAKEFPNMKPKEITNLLKEVGERRDNAKRELKRESIRKHSQVEMNDREIDKAIVDKRVKLSNARKAKQSLESALRDLQKSIVEKASDYAMEVINFTKGTAATGEVSYILRQGLIPLLTDTRLAIKGDFEGIGHGLRSEANSNDFIERIREHPRLNEAQAFGVRFTEVGDHNIADEHFSSRVLEKIPGYRRLELAYTLPGDLQRLFLFDAYSKIVETQGLTVDEEIKAKKYIAKVVNAFTGKGDIGTVLSRGGWLSKLANTAFFSPSLLISRFQSVYHLTTGVATAPKGMRMQMAKKGARVYTAIALLAYLAGMAFDPDDDDFGKVRIGDTVYQPLGGMDLPLQLLWRNAAAFYKSLANDDFGYFTDSLSESWQQIGTNKRNEPRFLRGKLSPSASWAVDYFTGTDYIGRPYTHWNAITSRMIPLAWSQSYDALVYDRYDAMMKEPADTQRAWSRLNNNEKKLGNMLSVMLPIFVGIGVNQYPKGEMSPATEKAGQLADYVSKKDSETLRVEGGLRNLIKEKLAMQAKGENTGQIDRVISTFEQKYAVSQKVMDRLRREAKSNVGLISFYAKDLNVDQLLRVLPLANDEERPIIQKLIKEKSKPRGR